MRAGRQSGVRRRVQPPRAADGSHITSLHTLSIHPSPPVPTPPPPSSNLPSTLLGLLGLLSQLNRRTLSRHHCSAFIARATRFRLRRVIARLQGVEAVLSDFRRAALSASEAGLPFARSDAISLDAFSAGECGPAGLSAAIAGGWPVQVPPHTLSGDFKRGGRGDLPVICYCISQGWREVLSGAWLGERNPDKVTLIRQIRQP